MRRINHPDMALKRAIRVPEKEFLVSSGLGETQVIGKQVSWYQRISSTMDVMLECALVDAPEGFVVVADEQTCGRGRHRREWISSVGEDLLTSVLLRPPVNTIAQLSMLAGLSVATTVDSITGGTSTLKWPNDVRFNGMKIAGILIESRVESKQTLSVIGIGLNVNSDASKKIEIAGRATSLHTVTQRKLPRTEVLTLLLRNVDQYYARVLDGESLHDEWVNRIDTLGQEIRIKVGSEIILGVAELVDRHGHLVLRNHDGKKQTFSAGDVTLEPYDVEVDRG